MADEAWVGLPWGPRPHARTIVLRDSDEQWRLAADALLRWGVKTRSGFSVHPIAWTGLRCLTGPGLGLWRAAFPLVLLAQGWYRRRFIHAMRSIAGPPR